MLEYILMALILASNSPRRRQLLALGGWAFLVLPAHLDESILPGESPAVYVRRLAEQKARAVGAQAMENHIPADALVVAADTAVVDGFLILGKPADESEAQTMLRSLRGRTHQVFTGLAVLRVEDGELRSQVCISCVPMRAYTDAEMLAYIASGDPLDKAGAYAIQHAGFQPVSDFQGCQANVMGLPLCHLSLLMTQFGLPPAADVAAACQRVLEYTCPIYRRALAGDPVG